MKEGEEFKNRIHFIQNNPTNAEFAEEGDSGSLICFEATDSPQLSSESAAFIFVGKCLSGKELFPEEFKEKDLFAGLEYHVSNLFECTTPNLNPMLTPGYENGSVQQGAGIQFQILSTLFKYNMYNSRCFFFAKLKTKSFKRQVP